ncbi:BrnA antitoxin family protein [Sphingopyxis panaciterrulae]|uniref:Uncharacterized protein (DUF4415 family) n=1 Tax=Sphingopyxis panaciterrulae TaxID=462372 RepID=A0A7W9EPG6_9SPHN|nr:BrnA antitoxin family protein [Sphingopyxis panaciterrulae]MBB5705449.1 uncharacterized protein (DUF4415 family) [Sphingopyxis panaciterrulae]
MTEGKFSQADADAVSDNPEWTAEDFAKAVPFDKAFPDLAAKMRATRGKQKAPTKVSTTLRLDRDVLERFKASGPGWQSRMNKALRAAAGI